MKINRPYEDDKKPIVYIIPSPIGNLKDITLRAIDILKEVDVIACEDTRVTAKLLSFYNIKNKKIISLYSQNEVENSKKIVNEVKKNSQSLAYLSDAGTPGISDPGGILIQTCYENDIKVTCLPGASALTTGVVISNINSSHFSFFGFLPTKESKIKEILNSLSNNKETLVFYESPLRVISTLKIMKEVFGGDRIISLIRELTKIHEEITNGSIDEIISSNPLIKGECIIVVTGREIIEYTTDDIDKLIEENYSKGISTSDLAKKVSKISGISKKNVYNRILEKEGKNEK